MSPSIDKQQKLQVDIDIEKGLFDFSGTSHIKDMEAFAPTFDLIKSYIEHPPINRTVLNCRFEYFDSNTSRLLMEIFHLFEETHSKGNEVIVNWHSKYEDIDMKDSGVLYEELCNLPFNHICIQ